MSSNDSILPFHQQILDNSVTRTSLPALTDNEGTMTFGELIELSEKFAALLQKKGVNRESSILICLANNRWQAVSFLAAGLLGATVSGATPHSTAEELRFFASRSDADLIVFDVELLERVSCYLSHLPYICVGDAPKEVTSIPRDLTIRMTKKVEISLDTPILQPFSSGTSGTPKCLTLTHKNIIAATTSLKQALFDELLALTKRKVTVSVLPLYHASGFWAMAYCLLEGIHVVLLPTGHPKLLIDALNKYQVETLNVVPSLISSLISIDTPVPSLRYILCGAGAISSRMEMSILKRFPSVDRLIRGYGLTEVVVLSHITPLRGKIPPGSCGRLLPGFEAKVIDEKGHEVKKTLHSGELWLRGPAVTIEYKTSETNLKPDGWLQTGDVVYFDSEGFYFIIDRIKELIKVNGLQVSPTEIEEIINSHPLVKESAVIGIPHHSKGEVPKAFVVLASSVTQEKEEKVLRQIQAAVKERLASFKQLIGGIEIRKELSHSASGKIQRHLLRPKPNVNK